MIPEVPSVDPKTQRSLLRPARYPDETKEEYQARRRLAAQVCKQYLRGRPVER